MSSYSYGDIITFWFNDETRQVWFNSNLLFDAELKEKYETIYLAACNDELLDWSETSEGMLALVIIFDQFPLNMYRDSAKSFATEERSRKLAQLAIDKKWDQKLSQDQKSFLYMPFMHSEDLADQDRAIALYEQAGLEESAKFAHHHRAIVARFGRFPHRNAILGRASTDAEKNYLVSGEAFLG